MNPKTPPNSHSAPDATARGRNPGASPEHLEEFGGGHIKSRHGFINRWLLVVYVILFIWALYYGFTYWGGLGPGLDY